MPNTISHNPDQRKPNYRLRQGLAAAGVTALALVGIKEVVNYMSKPAAIESQARQSEENITRQAASPEGLYLADTSAENSPLADVSIRIHKGVRLRHTPAIISNDGDAGTRTNAGPESDDITVTRPLQYRDKNGDVWYGFTQGFVKNPPQPDAAKATLWVNATELQFQEKTSSQEELISIIPTEPVEGMYLTYSPTSGYNLVEQLNTFRQGINVAVADPGR